MLPRIERRSVAAFGLILLCVSSPARAQVPDRAIEFEDLGFTRGSETSARGAALSAFTATTGDVSALIYNPAGLARIKRRVPVLGIARESAETITSYDGPSSARSSDRIGVQLVGAALPIPVLQGSLVPAVAVYRAFVSDLDIAYERTNPVDNRTDEFRVEQSGSTFAFSLGFGIDLASAISAGVSVFALEGGYQSLRQWHTRTLGAPPAVDRYVVEDIEGDLDGIGARVGMILYAHRHLHVAVSVTTPTLVNGSTNQVTETTELVENSTGTFVRTTTSSSAEYVIPYRVDGGIEFPWGDWLVAVQAGTCDWSQAAIDNQSLRLQNGSAVLGKTVDFRAGLEWSTPWWPVRLRAGLARLPLAPAYLEADRIDNDQMEAVETESAPLRYSIGAGIALKHTIVIDAVFTRTSADRSAASFSEERTWSQVMIEGSYWF